MEQPQRDGRAGQPAAQRLRGTGPGDAPAGHAHGEAGRRDVEAAGRRRSSRSSPGSTASPSTLERAGAARRCRPTSAQFIEVDQRPRPADVAARPRSPSRPAGCSGCASPASTRRPRRRPPPRPGAPTAAGTDAGAAADGDAGRRTAPAKKAAAKKAGGQEGAGEEAGRRRSAAPAHADALTPSALGDERRRHDACRAAPCRARRRRPACPTSTVGRHEGRGRCRGRAPARSCRSSPRRPASPSTSDRAVGPRRAAALGGDADEVAGDARRRARPRARRGRGTSACPTPRPSRARPAAA